MKNVTLAILIALLLSSSAFAAGNWVAQSNSQSAGGNGWGSTVDQTSSNYGMVIGDGNSASQYNGQYADMSSTFGSIYQGAANELSVEGDYNTIWQDNQAGAFDYGSLGQVTQTQENLGAITGDSNELDQNNYASANLNSYGYSGTGIIDQMQGSESAIVGNSNQPDQNNYASATSSGDYNFIAQTQDNMGLITGNDNYVSQNNNATGEIDWGSDNSIEQMQSNIGAQMGNSNSMSQDNELINWANYYSYWYNNWGGGDYSYTQPITGAIVGGNSNIIIQDQSNTGAQVGNDNYLVQTNDAFATTYNDYGNYIGQYQNNTGIQAGNDNYLYQYNNLVNPNYNYNSGWYDYSYGYWGGNYGSSSNPVAGAIVAGNSNTIIQDQSNTGAQIGNNNYIGQINDAFGEIDWGSNNYIAQYQSNTAAQDGDYNSMSQYNSLVNQYYDNYYSGWYYYNWWYSDWGEGNGYSYTGSPVASAIVSGDSNTIIQDQSNTGAQTGNDNWMGQYNDAFGKIDSSWSSSIVQDQSNAAAQEGDYNTIDQNNDLVSDPEYRYYSGSYYDWWPDYYYYSWWNDQQTLPVPAASIQDGTFSGTAQYQSNTGLQAGTFNWLDQDNAALSPQGSPAYSYILQDQSNGAMEVGDGDWWNGNHLTQSNIADASNYGGYNEVRQTESNLAAIAGLDQLASQSNYQYASPDSAGYDGYDLINQYATNSLIMDGAYDTSYQSNNQSAYQGYYTDTQIYQDASNDNTVISEETP